MIITLMSIGNALKAIASLSTVIVLVFQINMRVSVEFKISHYKLEKSKFDLTKNTVAMCAKSSPIKPRGNLVLSSAR